MFLVAAATDNEIKSLPQFPAVVDRLEVLVTGMGPVTTAASLSSYLTLHSSRVEGVVNIGVAGAYVNSGLSLLDICLAQQEFWGDFGICLQDGIQDFDPGLHKNDTPLLFNNNLFIRVENILQAHGFYHLAASDML